MPDSSQLPFLLQLLEDPSPMVQRAVHEELSEFGDDLGQQIESISDHVRPEHVAVLRAARLDKRRNQLLTVWPSWFPIENDYLQLETALELLSTYMRPNTNIGTLTNELNLLADEFRAIHTNADSYDLAKFLFETKGFKGSQSKYYSPERSNLLETIRTHSGNPISLTCIFMLVGYRVGITVHGCNFPGHFLAMAEVGHELVLIDCFNEGRIITPSTFKPDASTMPVARLEELLQEPANAETIIRRILNNLVNSYTLEGDDSRCNLIQELLDLQREWMMSPDFVR